MAFRIASNSEAFSRQPTGKQSKPVKDWTDRLFDERPGTVRIECGFCQTPMHIPPSKRGQRAHCSRECADSARQALPRRKPWGERLFEERPGTVQKPCEVCETTMWLPPSKTRRRFCSDACQRTDDARAREKRSRKCQSCGSEFVASHSSLRVGKGYFCSQKCNAATGRLSTPANLGKAQAGRRKAFAEGRFVVPSGPDNPQWKGGPTALRQRQTESGKTAKWLRRYRRENPEKVREFRHRRKSRMLGRLPEGTVSSLHQLQKGKCAICRDPLKKKWHLDHINPLAKGGEHSPRNLQLLCVPCNLRKSDRDPIEHMQSLGRLL